MKKTKTIGIAGAQTHIGATTQALQLLQYLQLMGNQVAYVEMSGHGYLSDVEAAYDDINQMAPGHIYIDRIEMYGQEYIKSLIHKEYDYLIKDYGAVTEPEFNRASFMEQEQKIIVAGIKPNEINYIYEILKESSFDDVSYLLTFVDNAADLRKEVRSMFDYIDGRKKYIKSDRVFFSDYAPDPFQYTGVSNKTYSDLLNCLTEIRG